MIWVSLGIFGLAIGLYGLFREVRDVRENLRNRDVDHAMCIAHVSHYTGNQFAADVLEAAAIHYDSAEGEHERVVIGTKSDWKMSDPPIPALWLRERAAALRAEVES